jgi:hypothetical protein
MFRVGSGIAASSIFALAAWYLYAKTEFLEGKHHFSPAPIVLCHGFLGWDLATLPGGSSLEYFKDVADFFGSFYLLAF